MIVLRSDDEIAAIRKAGRILAKALEKLKVSAVPGVRTDELDRIARDVIMSNNGVPAFKGYRGFPGNICTSINEVVVHGIPGSRKLLDGDIVSIDVGVKYENFYADAAFTVGVGTIDDAAKKLIRITEDSLVKGIESAKAGARLSDVSFAVQQKVEENGFSVVRAFVGHGIGTSIHEEPEIPNYGKPGRGPKLAAGMILAIEPMVNAGTYEVDILDDGWTVVTKDGKLSAHFEHTIAIRKDRPEILTLL